MPAKDWPGSAPDQPVRFNVLDRGFARYQAEFEEKALAVLRGGFYVLGPEVAAFEREFAAFIGASHCVGVGNGLDALEMAFQGLGIGPGDEVVVQSNAYIACVLGITAAGATPVFAEPNAFYTLDAQAVLPCLSERTKAVLAVHLYGQACPMEGLSALCEARGLYLVEDCAQSHGARYNDQTTGSFGDVACFSFYPTKNLGAFGDAGALVTSDAILADKFRMLRNYGSKERYQNEILGRNSRLDELQAALLRVRLSHLDAYNQERRKLAARYLEKIQNPKIQLPKTASQAEPVYHLFVVRAQQRQALQAHLRARGIESAIHYPIPPHLSKAYRALGYQEGDFPVAERYAQEVLSLPLYAGMTEQEQDRVIAAVEDF